jgi:hypothetical protein
VCRLTNLPTLGYRHHNRIRTCTSRFAIRVTLVRCAPNYTIMMPLSLPILRESTPCTYFPCTNPGAPVRRFPGYTIFRALRMLSVRLFEGFQIQFLQTFLGSYLAHPVGVEPTSPGFHSGATCRLSYGWMDLLRLTRLLRVRLGTVSY